PPLATNPRNGKLVDQAFFLQALPAVSSRQIISGFSGGIIQQARYSFIIVSDLFKYTTFRSCKKSQVHNYKYSDAQLHVNTGNELNIRFNQFKSSTPAIFISNGNLQLKLAAAKAETGISKKIQQCLLPLTIDSNDDTLTEFLIHSSDNEFAAITAYSLAQIDVSQSFILSLQIAIYLNGPQAVEQPIHSLIRSQALIGNNLQERENIFYNTTLYSGSKAVKVCYPHKFLLAWKMATDDSFMRRYNASKMGARTNIQVSLSGSLTEGIVGTELIKRAADENQNNVQTFVVTRVYPTPTYAQITPQMHYLCDAIIRFTFDDAPDQQVLNFEIIGEVCGTMIRSG
ncbi:MAG: hypothetical protein EZS28_044728, partial [Streblomastix strix]